MCGIAGILHIDRQHSVDPERLHRMTDAIAHRGPDGEGHWIDGQIGLGHRRLSIIDLSTGDQPMQDDSGSTVIIFNGEIYNYIELREELVSLGHSFSTESDTEVILKAYAQWGFDCQERLNGMWAFAIWDTDKHQLFLSRDRIGEKPLYWTMHDDTFLFGSEIKAILDYGYPRAWNGESLELYLYFSYVPAPYTFFRGISQLMPGQYMIVRDGIIRTYTYWDLPEIDENDLRTDRESVYREFERLMTDSIRIRMRSDVPYGAFLSGGLDSSCVVAVMSDMSSHPVETFTIGFAEEEFDESPLAQLVADRFHTNHHSRNIAPDTFDQALEQVHHYYDDPFGDSSAIPTGHVAMYARERVKMVLTGDGGDEVLSGYTIYQGEKFAGRYRSLPSIVRTATPAILRGAAGILTGKLRYQANRAIDVSESSNLDFESRLITKLATIRVDTLRRLLGDGGSDRIGIREYIADLLERCPYRDPFYKLMYYNLKNSLPNDMLVKVDRMAMAHSLETRVPFLDPRLIEYMVGVDKTVKMEGFERKSVLRRTLARRLPKQICTAPKKGFRVPLREWFKGAGFDTRLESLEALGDELDGDTIRGIVQDTRSGRRDYGGFLWSLFVLRRWLERI